MFFRFVHVIVCIGTPFIDQIVCDIMDIPHFIHSSDDRHSELFQILAITNNASMYICLRFFMWPHIFSSLDCIPKSGIPEPYGNSILNNLENYQTILESSCTILYSYQKYMSLPIFSHPSQHIICGFDYNHANWCEVASHCSLIYNALMINDFEHYFMFLLLFAYLL